MIKGFLSTQTTHSDYYEGDTVKYEIKFELPFTKKQLKIIGLTCSWESNGCFWYDKDLVVVNLGSGDFEGLSENSIAKLFYKVDTHERLHSEIYYILDEVYNNDTEERFVELMTGQEEWKQ